MQFTTLILFAACLQVSAVSYAQKISISGKNIPLQRVFNKIRAQTNYNFIYTNEDLSRSLPVTLHVENSSLKHVLDLCFSHQPLTYKINDKIIIVKVKPAIPAIPQTPSKEITGHIKDSATGQPLAGVTIKIKGTTSGTVTDATGAFSLQVEDGAVLEISYLGYASKTIPVNGNTTLDITLSATAKGLNQLVVVGFGTQKKVNLTGAVGMATAKDLESRPVTSATQALQGLVPGLKISTNTGELDQNMNISVRGTGTIGSSSGAPLILIDGMEGDLNTINPQDIESISVLKDAAASSIYGSRAPFGVILVTTKKGKAGKISINYNNSFRIASPINLPESMNSYDFAVMMNQGSANKGVQPFFSNETMQKMLDFQAGKLSESLEPDPNNPDSWGDIWTRGYANTDIYKETYKKNVFSQAHNLSATGGSEKITYYASFGYLNQGGLLNYGDDGLKRYNVTGKISATLTNWLKFNYSSRFVRNDVWEPEAFSGGFYDALGRSNWPNRPIFDPNGYFVQDFWTGSLIDLALGGKRDVQEDQQYHQAAFIIEPVKNWVTNIEFNYRVSNTGEKSATIPTYAHDVNGNVVNTHKTSSLYQDQEKENYLNLNIYSTYSRSFNEAHHVKIMGGFQAEEMKQSFFSVSKDGIVFNDLPEFDLTNGLDGSGNPQGASVSGYRNEWATAGFFGRLNYNYKGRYLFEANMRYDGTSRFRTGSQWALSPSFSAGWNIARENFWEPLSHIANFLKLRFSYGELGNQNTNDWYPTYRAMNLSALNGSWLQDGKKPNTASVGSLVSTTLTWESVRQWNAGLDYGFFNNRLSGSFDYFIRYTINMVGPAPELPATLGIAAPQTNNTDLHTKGWELSVGWKDQLGNGLSYGVSLNLSDQVTVIDAYPSNKTQSIDTYIGGMKDALIWGYETIGIARSQKEMDAHLASLPNGGQDALGSQWSAGDIMYKDLNGDGKISAGSRTLNDHGDLKILGNSYSHYFFGVDLTASWKGFDFRCFLQGVLKHDLWPGSTSNFWGVSGGKSLWHSRGFKAHNDYFRAKPVGLQGHEIPANLDAYFPRPIFDYGAKNQQVQTRYMQDARYLRVKNLQLGYSLPAAWIQKAGISQCRFFISGENLLTFTPLFSVFDPETVTGGAGGNAYPLSRTWSFGLSITL